AGPIRGLRPGASLQWQYGRNARRGIGSEDIGRTSAQAQRTCLGTAVGAGSAGSAGGGSPAGRVVGTFFRGGRMTMPEGIETFDEFESTAIFADDQALRVAVDGFEGPLDLLLTLARNQ